LGVLCAPNSFVHVLLLVLALKPPENELENLDYDRKKLERFD
jgi:hypothetical protein